MFKYAREIFYCSLALFFVTLTVLSIYTVKTVFGDDGVWLSGVAVRVMQRRQTPTKQDLGDRVVERLLAHDGRLTVKIIQQVMQSRTGATQPRGADLLLSRVMERLLANDGALLSKILASVVTKRKSTAQDRAFTKLLANDGELLSKVLVRVMKARSAKQIPIQQRLTQNPAILSQVLGDVLVRLGGKGLVQEIRTKVRAIRTEIDLRQEIRHALRNLPALLTEVMERQRQKKLLDDKAWRNIKAQFPNIVQDLKTQPCIAMALLRRGKKNKIRVRVRVKALNPPCRKMSCAAYIRQIDQTVLKWTRNHGVHEGHIQIFFNLIKHKCNTNR